MPAQGSILKTWHHLDKNEPHLEFVVPLKHQDDFGAENARQCQREHHDNVFSWSHEKIPKSGHQICQ